MSVYVSNLVIDSGADFFQSFNLELTQDNSALDLSNYTAQSQMRKHSGSSSFTEFSAFISDPHLGEIQISLDSTQTSALKPGRYVYDVIITDTLSEIKTKVIEGMVLVREGVTR